MLMAMALAAILVGYVFVAGVVRRVLTMVNLELTRHAESFFAGIWPLIPIVYGMYAAAWLIEAAARRVTRLGELAADAPGGLARRWRRRGTEPLLHDDCASFLGPCDECRDLLDRRARAGGLPRARVVR